MNLKELERIKFIEKPSDANKIEKILHPLVKEWFFSRFNNFSLTQLYGVETIWNRKNILISAPTGGTKTLTAFLAIINYLVGLALKNELEGKIYAVYVSPLKALSNDIYVNLETPIKEIEQLAEKRGLKMQKIVVGLRTGDTSASERAKQTKNSPHIYITTPESLAIVLSTKKFIEKLGALEFIIVDEVHAMANKRGVHLSLSLERICECSVIEPVRIGLSATIAPLDEIAKFLVGEGRECFVANVDLIKKIEIDLIIPSKKLFESETIESQKTIYKILDELIQQHKTTLIFTNTRSATERVIHHLNSHFPGKYVGLVGAHHSSISKKQRFYIEDKLRRGELRVVVTSTSLELGIDIGSIDLVVLLRSPKGVARALQRVGRAGHKLHENPKGKFIVFDRDDLVECSVLMKHMIERKIDRVTIPSNALDVLSQHIYGMAINKIWKAKDMLNLIRKSYCYRDLSEEDFYSVISYLAGDYALEHRNVYAKIWYDEKTKEIGKRGKLARMIYMTNVGTIPEEGFIEVVVGSPLERKGEIVGSVDEAFIEKIKGGDVFVLGGSKYQFLYSRGMKAYVKAGIAQNPTVPSWFSEMLPLSFDAAVNIGHLRTLVKEKIKKPIECIEFLQKYLYCNKECAEEIYFYMKEQADFSELPDEKTILIERFKGEKEYALFHSVYGRRVNDALSVAFGYVAGKIQKRDIEIGINDNGFYLAGQLIDINKIIPKINNKNFEVYLREAIEKTDVLKRRFRHCASRSLMILKNYKGRIKSVGKQQVRSDFLLSSVKKISNNFPILKEARREVLEDVMDIHNAKKILEMVERGEIKLKIVQTPLVSPFGINLIMQSHVDLIKIEERAAFLKRMHELHMSIIKEKNKF